jgi:hypothetical protein
VNASKALGRRICALTVLSPSLALISRLWRSFSKSRMALLSTRMACWMDSGRGGRPREIDLKA